MKRLIECVPNFSEGRDMNIIRQITSEIEKIDGVRLLNVDPGNATNRTVVTFVGEPEHVITAAFNSILKASEIIDMSRHKGEHPRFGATDVCPLIPISGVTMEETVNYARKLGEMVGKEIKIPVYLYENAATSEIRRNLANIREGEYEGLKVKLLKPEWKPDFGPSAFNVKTGAVAIGARDFLIAYNVNLNTTSTRRANAIAYDIREKGRVKREGDSLTGKIIKNDNGEPVYIPGTLKAVKAVGWYIEEFGIAQISINLTNINITPVHIAFEEVCKKAEERGIRVTGSELVGLIPLKSMLEAGKYFLKKQQRSTGVSEKEIIKIAIKSLGLNDLYKFEPEKKIIEYLIADNNNEHKLLKMNLIEFAEETASESPAPGGGSISAYVGALGIALGTMVANLSAHKRGWDERWDEFSGWADKGQAYISDLLKLVDEDTKAFNSILEAFGLPANSDEDKKARKLAVQEATKNAIEVPFSVMKKAFASMEVIKKMAETGNPNSASDTGVAAMCALTAIKGASLNVRINASGLDDKEFINIILTECEQILQNAAVIEKDILKMVDKLIDK